MNTANPQLEGLYLAVAAINRLLVEKGLATHQDIHEALQGAEQTVLSDAGQLTISPSHQKAVAFPIRFLMLANEMAEKGGDCQFEPLAREIGRRT